MRNMAYAVSTLEALVRLRIGVELWSLTDIKDTLIQLLMSAELDWKFVLQEMHAKIWMKILGLPLPYAQKRELLWIVKPIGVQIQSWLGRYKYLFLSSNQRIRAFVNSICWTSKGAMDEKKSTSLLLDCNVLDVSSSYKLACNFCLVGHIVIFWQMLCECQMDISNFEKVGNRKNVLVSYWSTVMKNGHCNLMKHNVDTMKCHFLDSVRTNNVFAAKYFWHMLKPRLNAEESEDILMKSLVDISQCIYKSFEKPPFYYPMHFRSSLVFYLYTKLNKNSRCSFFSDHFNKRKAIVGFLLAFLNWPFHEMFLNLNAYFWSLSPPVEEYMLLFKLIFVKIEAERENFCPRFINKIWSQIPAQYRVKSHDIN